MAVLGDPANISMMPLYHRDGSPASIVRAPAYHKEGTISANIVRAGMQVHNFASPTSIMRLAAYHKNGFIQKITLGGFPARASFSPVNIMMPPAIPIGTLIYIAADVPQLATGSGGGGGTNTTGLGQIYPTGY